MMWSGFLLTVLAVVVVAQELPLAGPCNLTCQLPSCRCSSTAIPGGLAPRNTPQFVMVTFDDSVNVINMETYREILYNRFNFNGCRAGATFYVSHEYTNYQLINELYNQGFEIALHTISHQTPSTYWQQATVETLRREIGDQKEQMAHFANIPQSAIHGVRMPFLQMAGNNTFVVKNEYGLTYDCSMPTNAFVNPGLWPYTLHHASLQDCLIPPCPTASIPGPWVIPMVSWSDLQGVPCSMADGCHFTPEMDDEEGWFQFIVRNFENHYLGNRAPFGYFVHEWYVRTNPGVKAALVRFMDMISNLPDVFMVNSMDVIEWVRNPVPVDQYRARSCRFTMPAFCPAATCGPLPADHNPHNPGAMYWMSICNSCPRVHPWVGNHLGR